MTTIRTTWLGKPLPKGRPRVVNGRAHTDAKTRAYETKLRSHFAAVRQSAVGDVGVVIELRFASGVHGDVDNCAKAILDAAQPWLFLNDKAVRSLHVWRRWADETHPEGFELTVCPLADDPMPKKKRVKRAAAREETR